MQSDRARARAPGPTHSAPNGGLRAFALFALLLLASAPFAQLAHFVLVPHAVCAAHGELVELRPHDAAGSQKLSPKPAVSKEGEPAPFGSDSTEHDHCQLVASAARNHGLLPVATSSILAPLTALASAALTATTAPRVSGSRLEVAPKTSPPASLPSAV